MKLKPNIILRWLVFLLPAIVIFSCSKEDENLASLSLLNATINGSSITGENQNVSTTATISLTFSGTISPANFESAFSLLQDGQTVSYALALQSSGTRINITPVLEPNKAYQASIEGTIGVNGEALDSPAVFSFKTADDENQTDISPCTGPLSDCQGSWEFSINSEAGNISYLSNYIIDEGAGINENIENAILVFHGINRNNDDYFSWVGSALRLAETENNTLLIAPKFKIASEAEGDDLYWSNTGWRSGRMSESELNISSFAVVDAIVNYLRDKDQYPNIEKIMITGHSSGGLFTHLYGASNGIDLGENDVEIEYVVANSQYFYYPDEQRLNENSGQLFVPSDCAGYNIWPMGIRNKPIYLDDLSQENVNSQFLSRSIYYFLGNASGIDNSLNTTDCAATLLGATRFSRGENIYEYLNLLYPEHNHKKRIVEGIGHDGQAMYLSGEFGQLLQEILSAN